jgi:hypothetical protein
MLNVRVNCEDNKVVFGNQHTVRIQRPLADVQVYWIARIEKGEAFTVQCPQGWRIFLAPDRLRGFITFGNLSPIGNPVVMPFERMPDGNVDWSEQQYNRLPEDLFRYTQIPISGIDMNLVVKYSLPVPKIGASKRIHFITQQTGDQKLAWVEVPEKQDAIRDGVGGVVVTVDQPKTKGE